MLYDGSSSGFLMLACLLLDWVFTCLLYSPFISVLVDLFLLILFLKHNCILCHRLLRSQPPRLASMVMLNVTLLALISSTPRSLKILSLLLTTVMYELWSFTLVVLSDFWTLSTYYEMYFSWHYFNLIQVPHVTRTDYQLIDISEDGFVCSYFFSCLWFLPLLSWLNLKSIHC